MLLTPSPFAFATTQPYQGLQKHLAAHLMSYADNPEASPWERCLAGFLRQLYARSHSTDSLCLYSATLHSFFCTSARDGTPKHPEAYTREDVEYFIYRLTASKRSRGAPPAASTVNQRLMILSSFYRYAASVFLVESSEESELALQLSDRLRPLLAVPSPTLGLRYGRTARSYRAFSFDELERFFAAIPTDTVRGLRDRAIFLIYFWTARRRSEIARLRWGDLEQGVIVDEQGKRRVGWLYHFRGKGHSGDDDSAELPAPAKAALDHYLEASGRLASMRPEDPLFLAFAPGGAPLLGQALSGESMSVALKKYARAAGLDVRRLTLHSFRHTAAQQRFAVGEDIRSLQRLLRHESLATTDIYLRGLMSSADNGALLLVERFGHLSDP